MFPITSLVDSEGNFLDEVSLYCKECGYTHSFRLDFDGLKVTTP